MCIFKPTCLTLPSARACPRTCFCACQSVSWGKIICSALSGSPRGLLGCWALLEPACREADMTAVLENEAKRTITPSASIFILQDDVSTSVVYMKWRTHIAQLNSKGSQFGLRILVYSPCNQEQENCVKFFMQSTNLIIHEEKTLHYIISANWNEKQKTKTFNFIIFWGE